MPAGDAFVPAFVDAAAKYALRRKFTPEAIETFVDMVRLSVVAVNTSSPSAVLFHVTEFADRVEAVTHCTDPSAAISGAAIAKLTADADRCLSLGCTDDPPSIRFSLERG